MVSYWLFALTMEPSSTGTSQLANARGGRRTHCRRCLTTGRTIGISIRFADAAGEHSDRVVPAFMLPALPP